MKFKVNRLKLLNALSKTTKAVSVRSPLPVLELNLIYNQIV